MKAVLAGLRRIDKSLIKSRFPKLKTQKLSQKVAHDLKMETATEEIHSTLNAVTDMQTHFRLGEAKGRIFAEDLNGRVNMWSIGQTIFILLLGVGQVFILRSFFTEKKPFSKPINS